MDETTKIGIILCRHVDADRVHYKYRSILCIHSIKGHLPAVGLRQWSYCLSATKAILNDMIKYMKQSRWAVISQNKAKDQSFLSTSKKNIEIK